MLFQLCFIIVAEVRFEHSLYSVNEGSDVEICVISSDNVRAPIFVNITFVSETAQSELFSNKMIMYSSNLFFLLLSVGVDFMPVGSPNEVLFSSGSERICSTTSTVNDSTVESEETFTVVLSTGQERVAFSTSNSIVSILDDDGR